MSRPLQVDVDVPAGVEAAFSALTGPGWAPALDARLGDGSVLVSARATAGGGAVVVLDRRLPEGGPAFVRALVPAGARVTQTDCWSPAEAGQRRAGWSAEVPGTPAQVSGEMVLAASAQGCRWSVRGAVSVRVPLVGGRVEGFLAPLLERLVVAQGEVLRSLV